jgi:hypothetical protein
MLTRKRDWFPDQVGRGRSSVVDVGTQREELSMIGALIAVLIVIALVLVLLKVAVAGGILGLIAIILLILLLLGRL